ncbi:reverse transcriptase domain-containing protein, partial [Tanacetum coccineum]
YDEDGNVFHNDDMAAKFMEHFKKFFGKCDVVYPIEDHENLFTKKLNPEMAMELIKPVSDEEIKMALFDIEDNKASGPDGYTSKFFKSAWSVRHVMAEKKFKYHWGCKELKITSLCFKDDLLLLCHGDLISASVLRRGLDEFCLSSGLLPSMSKSKAFFGNVPNSVKADISLVMPFKEGVLPIKYLGVPMGSKMITDKDCMVMVEIIRKRVGDWRNKSLLFAGSQGGLGLRSTHLWNEALLAKHIWNVVSRKESIWVKWVNIYKLKGRSMWDIEFDRGSSWCWKSLLDLRSKIERFVQVKISNGWDCNIWFDKWHPRGPLSRLINQRVMEHADMSLKLRVSDMVKGNEWVWPIEWDDRFEEVINVPVPKLIADFNDKTVWVDKHGKEKMFVIKEVWKVVRVDCPKVIWYRHVWFSQCIPRHAFILWVAIKGRLKTLDRISKWVNVQSMLMAKLEGISNDWASIERNGRCFMKKFRDVECLYKIFVDTIRMRLMGLTMKYSSNVQEAASIWNFKINNVDYYRRMVEELLKEDISKALSYGDGLVEVWLVPGFPDDSEFPLSPPVGLFKLFM